MQKDVTKLNFLPNATSKNKYLVKNALHSGSFEENYNKENIIFNNESKTLLIWIIDIDAKTEKRCARNEMMQSNLDIAADDPKFSKVISLNHLYT